MVYQSVPGARIEAIGLKWAVWSPLSGDTHVLNDEAAAILEVLTEQGTMATEEVAQALMEPGPDGESQASAIQVMVELTWPVLLSAGLVRMAPQSTL